MYSSGYSQVNKFSPEAQKKMQYRSKGKSCGYYMRIIFFFSSLIQSLIIVSLVLFLIYGNVQVSASSNPDQDLEKRFSQISIENVALQKQRKNLTNLLNATLTEKAKNDYDLAQLKILVNRSIEIFKFQSMELKHYEVELVKCKMTCMTACTQTQPPGNCNCGLQTEQLKMKLQVLESNLTTTSRSMTLQKDQIAKERDNQLLEAIHLRQEKSILEKELNIYKQNSKNEFSQLLSQVSAVSKGFLQKIDSLFPKHIAFQLTCAKQKEHLEQIHSNCTSLSRDVENKLQHYLNVVGEQVSDMQIENTRLKAENWRLSEDYREVIQNRTGIIEQHKRSREALQQKHDQEKERLLMDKMKLTNDNNHQLQQLKYKDLVMDDLKDKLKQLNMSCMARNAFGGYPGGGLASTSSIQNPFGTGLSGGGGSSYSPFGSSSIGQSRTGPGAGPSQSQSNAGSVLNRAASIGPGSASSIPSSYGSRSSPGNTGSTFNQPGSAGAGSISSILQQPKSNPTLSAGSGINRPSGLGLFGSTLGSSGTQPDKLAESGKSLSSFGSSVGSLGSRLNQGSAGTGLNNPPSGGKSSPGYGLPSSSVSSLGSSASKTSSSPSLSWLDFGLGSSNSGQSKIGGVPGKPSIGSGNVGTGPVLGGGRTSGQPGGSVITKHIQDLQRFIDPPAPQEKQDLSRMLG